MGGGPAALLAALLSDGGRFAWFGTGGRGTAAAVGAAILLYNAALFLVLRAVVRRGATRTALLTLACTQMLLDLACLTVLTVLSGGIGSPVRRILHLPHGVREPPPAQAPRLRECGPGASADDRRTVGDGAMAGPGVKSPNLLAWVAMLMVTVWLANGITRRLRKQRRRLVRQNRRIHQMSGTLRRQQQALIQHEKMAVAGRIAAGIAHEIANPLASMDGLLQLIERRPDKPPEAIATLREQVGRINQIVHRMTAFAHPGDGEWQVRGLADAVERALEVVASTRE